MANYRTYITDLRDYLTKTGSVASMPDAAMRLVNFLGSIVVYATTPRREHREPMKCKNRTGHKPCSGEIEIRFQGRTGAIAWMCPVCGEKGTISNWKGTMWDRRKDSNADQLDGP